MTSHENALARRLCEADGPYDVANWEANDGYYIATCRISSDDIPQLIDIARSWADPDWPSDDLETDADDDVVTLLPVTAWRALAELKASEAVQPLVDMLGELDVAFDDWTVEELPSVFGTIGAPAVDALLRLAADEDKLAFARLVAVEGLRCVGENHAETRDAIVPGLAEMMTKATPDDIRLNSTLLVALVDLRGTEAAEAIERAFANNLLDVGMMGDWEDVRRELGVEGLGMEMPKNPHNSVAELQRYMGIGIFSDKPIALDGDVIPDAEHEYYERAGEDFSKSDEANQVIERFGDLGWFQMLLDFGVNYRGEIVDVISVGGVQEFVLEHVPRKVSVDPSAAGEIVFELTKFWEYLDRVHELPDAKSIVEWLKTDGVVAELEAALSDPANFGLAKSIFAMGTNAGYDMSSQDGAAEFVAEYNRSLQALDVPQPAAAIPRRERVGRNDPCPCGSGKKFKKCCL